MKTEMEDTTATEPTRMEAALQSVGVELDRWAWQNLQSQRVDLALAVAAAVRGGARPDQIRQYVIDRTHRRELGDWVEQAARWLTHADD